MPTKSYYLDEARTTLVQLKWGLFFRNVEVFYQGQSLGVVPSTDALRQGYAFALPTGQQLEVRLQRSQGLQEVALLLDGQPVPGSATHPRERLKQAWYTLLFIGGLNVVLGLVAALGQVEVLLGIGLGWGSIFEGLFYLGLGWWGYSRQAPVAFGVALALFVLDGLFMLGSSIAAGGYPGIGGLFMRFFLGVFLYRGMQAARQLRAESQVAIN